jgi:hypothetical protein
VHAGYRKKPGVIPTAIFFGLIGGLIPRYRWWSIPVIGVIWSIMLTVGGDPTMSSAEIWIAGLALGALNGAVGVTLTWGISKLVGAIYGSIRDMERSS